MLTTHKRPPLFRRHPVLWIVASVITFAGCSQERPPVDHDAIDAAAPRDATPPTTATGQEACTDVGGTCLVAPGTGCSKLGAQDCNANGNLPNARCCLDAPKDCTESTGSIHASDYDQSCKVDADCTSVSEGDVSCHACLLQCATGVINRNELARYRSALDELPSPPAGEGLCHCPAQRSPCCIDGQCSADLACADPERAPLR